VTESSKASDSSDFDPRPVPPYIKATSEFQRDKAAKDTSLPIKVLCKLLCSVAIKEMSAQRARTQAHFPPHQGAVQTSAFVATKEMSAQRARTQAHVPSHKGAVQTIVFYRHQRNECAKGKDASTRPFP